MDILDRIRWTADRAISKARKSSESSNGGSEPPLQPKDYSLESVESIEGDRNTQVVDITPSRENMGPSPPTPEVKEPVVKNIVPAPLLSRANRLKRSIGASSREIEIDNAPLGLTFVGLVALIFASLYLMRLFASLDTIQEDLSFLKRIFAAGMILFLFYQYIGYVITIFQLKSGMRGSWASMVRTSGSYVILMLLAETHLFDWLPFNLVAFPSWLLLLCMACVMIYMMLPFVREYYKPPYGDMVPLTSWILFVFWVDPYRETYDMDMDVEMPIDL